MNQTAMYRLQLRALPIAVKQWEDERHAELAARLMHSQRVQRAKSARDATQAQSTSQMHAVILQLLADRKYRTAPEIARTLDRSRSTIFHALEILQEHGKTTRRVRAKRIEWSIA